MINAITSSSLHMYAAGGSSLPYVPNNPSNPSQGMLKLNGSDMEVFDGSSWQKIHLGNATIGLNNSANAAISWAIKRMEQEQEWCELASTNESVRIALENLEQARTRVELTAHLARDHDTETTS
jgi:hypothetical protein